MSKIKIYKKIVLTAFILLTLFNCNDIEDNEERTRRTESFTFFENYQIDVETIDDMQFVIFQPGDNLVFQYRVFSESSNQFVVDEETSTSLIFEISRDLDSFEFTNQELEDIKCYYLVGNSEFSSTKKINQGSIRGNRIDNGSWSIDITIENSAIEIYNLFTLTKRN